MRRLIPRRPARRYLGLHRATVVGATDPEARGRLEVVVPSVTGSSSIWASRLRDLGPRPKPRDEVLVGFAGGDPSSPYVIGVVATGSSAAEIADDNGNSIRLDSSGVEVRAVGEVRLTSSTVRVATGSAQVDAERAEFSTVVTCSALVADSVTAASYSPGVGNVM